MDKEKTNYGMKFVRYNSNAAPRFLKTLSESSKPPLTKPHVITKPFGLPAPLMLNPANSQGRWSLTTEIFGGEAKEMRQRQLDHDIKHSPFYESKSFTNTNGKIFTPSASYFKADKAKYFPNFKATAIDGSELELHQLLKGKVSLIRVFSSVSGDNCSGTYFKSSDTGDNYLQSDYPKYLQKYSHSQIIDLNIPLGFLKRNMVKIVRGSIKNSLPDARKSRYFILPDSLIPFDIKQELLCDNSCSGYIYLVDSEGKIRWATSGYANEKELQILWKCLKGVEKELTKQTTQQ